MQARAAPTDYLPTAPSTSLPTYNRSSVVEDDVSIFNINTRSDVSRIPSKGATQTPHPGGGPLWCSGHSATPTNRGNEASSSTSSLVSPTWSSSWKFPLPVLRLNSSWPVVRLHFAYSKAWIADYLESLSIRFSSRVYKAERFHGQPSSSTSLQAEQTFRVPPCNSPREKTLRSLPAADRPQSGALSRRDEPPQLAVYLFLQN